MQQSPRPQMNSATSKPLNLITTEEIQKHLDENKNLILAILENQRLGKMTECSQYQAILQKNLMYLAAIADAQPPGSVALTPTPTSSVTSQGNRPALQTQPASQGNPPVMQTQAPAVQQQGGTPVPKLPFHLNAHLSQDQQQQMLQYQQQQQQQMLQYQQQQQMLQLQQQQQQMLQYQQQQQQMQPQFGHGGGVNAGVHLFKQQQHGSPSGPTDLQGNQPGGSRPASDGSQGNSRPGPYQGSG